MDAVLEFVPIQLMGCGPFFQFQQLEQIVDDIEAQMQNLPEREMTSDEIGRLALEGLRELDQVAYIRFASVYREFKDIDSFLDELNILKNEK